MKPNIRPLAALITVLSCWLIIATTALIVPGCATLAPGADPLVVRTEQVQSIAGPGIDFVLHFDNADRGFWRTNAPPFHNFCEWLRTPIPYTNGTTLPRAILMQVNVDDLKQAYKFSKTSGNSNALYTALGTLSAALNQATSWSNIVVTPVHP